jgi:hypothetical protein
VSFLADTYLPASVKFSEKSNVLPAIQILKNGVCVMDEETADALARADRALVERTQHANKTK